VLPGRYHTWVSGTLSAPSCAIFFRRCVVRDRAILFDSRLRDLGDVAWVLKLIEHRVPTGVLGRFTSAFTVTAANMGQQPNAQRERAALAATGPAWARWCRAGIVLHYRLRRLLAGGYSLAPFDYAIYTQQSLQARVTMHVAKPAFGVPRNNPMAR
jgi:hypothetical protein